MPAHPAKTAILYRMVMPEHVCPYGLKARALLKSRGYAVDDRWLKTREETDDFKAEHGVKTTPQTFIGGNRIGGYDDLRRHFGKSVPSSDAVSYVPVIAVFAAGIFAKGFGWDAVSSTISKALFACGNVNTGAGDGGDCGSVRASA